MHKKAPFSGVFLLLFCYFLTIVFHKRRFECIPSETYTTFWIVILYFPLSDFVSTFTITISCTSVLLYKNKLWSCTTFSSYSNMTVRIAWSLIEKNNVSLFWYSCDGVYYSFPLRTYEWFTSEPTIECRTSECSNRISHIFCKLSTPVHALLVIHSIKVNIESKPFLKSCEHTFIVKVFQLYWLYTINKYHSFIPLGDTRDRHPSSYPENDQSVIQKWKTLFLLHSYHSIKWGYLCKNIA